ncbi:MAG: M20/M25/M40 family metallo-hydrolase [Planctomycetes bacterium]|nr:M20/M25/M40 family metallo-hydrolase [Planctomycetota bacterium]
MTNAVDRERALARVRALRPRYEAALRELLEIPSISSDPARRTDIRRCGEAAARLIRDFGGRARLIETPGNPVVVGDLGEAGSPAVTFYNHLDVQPAGGPEWTRPPFQFNEVDGRYFGRGATDDKGPALAALFGAAIAIEAGVRVRARFCWELEEEIGSPNFAAFLTKHARDLECRCVVVSDTIWISKDRPAIPYALRGMQTALLKLESAANDTHSGDTGGVVKNPISELCDVVAKCVDAKTGRVLIPGFYDDVVEATPAELDSFESSGFDLSQFRAAYALKRLYHSDARSVLRAMWARPTFEVHGIAGGFQGPGIMAIVPPRAEAKVSMRLVPNQDPGKIALLLRAHLKHLNPDLDIIINEGLAPYSAPFTGPHAAAARECYQFGFGASPALVREGGSIGPAQPLSTSLRVPIMFLGLSLPEHGYHAPNENFDWRQASGGMLSFAKFLELATDIR